MEADTVCHLCVFANMDSLWLACGDLSLVEDGTDLMASSFQYDRAYVRKPGTFSIDPVSLPIAGRHSAVGRRASPASDLPYFGAIRDATPDSWGRRVIESKLGAPLNGLPELQYILNAGSDRVGALDVRSDASSLPLRGKDSWDILPNLAEAAGLIERGLPIPQEFANIFVQGAGLGGARPKASVRDERGTLHLAKFSSEGDRFDVPAVEYATLRLARMAGLRVPEVRLELIEGRNVLLVRRFDRYWAIPGDTAPQGDGRFVRGNAPAGSVEHRIPFVSALTLAACDEMDSRHSSYGNLAGCLERYCRTLLAYDGAAELYKRMIFNVFVSNCDDHLRNHGFLWDAELKSWP
ncbi:MULTISPECIES: type II toxin-antitoxin system HipA family toxin [Caballeronia]|uniref:HipA domain-containing protein n=1 Tax=Caballeronia jiangsuensis TaxID=1458357 RepID=A0ABW9CFL5_9BURK|nr:HipA domain-containing protein [Caballeronia sp. GaOx3]